MPLNIFLIKFVYWYWLIRLLDVLFLISISITISQASEECLSQAFSRCLPLSDVYLLRFCFMCKFLLPPDIFPPHSQSSNSIILRKHIICLHSLPSCWCLRYLLPMKAENRAWGKLCEPDFHRDCRPAMAVLNPFTSSKWDSTGKGHYTEKSTGVEAE